MAGILTLLLLLLQAPAPAVCAWGPAVEIGTLDATVKESSGMAVSRRIPNRTYRHNDSGDTGRFFTMDLDGRNLKTVTIEAYKPDDLEDMALGPCDRATDCLFFADTGDNSRKRKNLDLIVVKEQATFPASVRPDYRVKMRYPDGPHDAESMAVHPDGSVYIATKAPDGAQIFRLKRNQWREGKGPQMLELVTTLEWPKLLPHSLSVGRVATSMDISPDGKRFIILTYVEAAEFFFDLSKPIPDPATWKEGQQYRRVPLTTLEQEEAIAYLPDGKGFLYDSERPIARRPARIMRVSCAK
jgi:hypothetical protein